MAEGVTYADLRFAKSPPEKSRPPGDSPREECSDGDGELTYENFPAGPQPRQTAGPGPHSQPQPPGAVRGRIWRLVPLALLGACLFLLATCLGLGLRYWQVSGQLEGASRRHTAESGALAQRLGSQEENLTQTLRLLSRAQAELSTTRLALRQSREDGNRTQRQLEGAESRLTHLQEEKAEAIRELAEAKRVLGRMASCQQTDCCPRGWKPFNQKCLWISSGKQSWEDSKQDCENNEAQLLILKHQDAGNFWQSAAIASNLRSGEFWIGLARKPEWSLEWHWVDGTRYTGSEQPSSNGWSTYCVKMSRRALKQEKCSSIQRYICEKAATPLSWSIDPSA